MKIAVIQHRIRQTLAEDAEGLSSTVLRACDEGARVVVCPWVPSIAVSASHVGLVLVSEPIGADSGEIGHGSSAVLYLGDVIAEAFAADEMIMVDVDAPVPAPEPREPLPQLSPILEQRLAVHEGRKATFGYLTDLS